MKAYLYDEKTKEFISEVNAQIDPLETKKKGENVYLLPANATFKEPPQEKEGFKIVFNGKEWGYEEIKNEEIKNEEIKPSLEDLKLFKRYEINSERDNARKIEGAEYDGDIFDIDEVSQSNILAQIKVAEIIGDPNATYNYRSKTNTDHLLTLAQLQELGLAIAVKVNDIYVKSWDLKAQVDKATTAEEVEAIKWTSA